MPDQPQDYEEVTEVSTEPWVPLPEREWTPPEKWVWKQVRTGQIADFNERYGKELDPKNESLWVEEEKERRTLRPDFLRTILLSEPWRSLITHEGVKIVGAYFGENINLCNAQINHELWLDRSHFAGGFDGGNTRFIYSLSFDGSCFHSDLLMNGAKVNGGFFLHRVRVKTALLYGLQVNGQLSAKGAVIDGKLALDGAEIKGDVFLREGRFASVRLLGVRVGGDIAMTGSQFSGMLALDRALIAGGLFLDHSRLYSVRLTSVKIGGQLALVGSRFDGGFDGGMVLDRAEISGDLFLRGANFNGPAGIIFSSIRGNLLLEGAGFTSLDLSGTHLGQALIDGGTDWPEKLELDGFTYKYLGSGGEGRTTDV